jgi:hypothetical protein
MPILLKTTMQNKDDKRLVYYENSSLCIYYIKIWNSRKEEMPRTRFGIIASHGGDSRNVKKTIDPGKKVELAIDLNRSFDLTLPGTYTIKIGRNVNEYTPEEFSFELTDVTFKIYDPLDKFNPPPK